MTLQKNLFLREIREQVMLSTIRSYLKLYTTIEVKKLADFLEVDEKTLRFILFLFL
jgi:translation initiation factor 3 subunit L